MEHQNSARSVQFCSVQTRALRKGERLKPSLKSSDFHYAQRKKSARRNTRRDSPAASTKMQPAPQSGSSDYVRSGKLRDKAGLITGGDSGRTSFSV
jgi:hypothetical protein